MKILGRSDRVDLPGLGLTNIHAKVDTGAYTCSLHCGYANVVNNKLEFVLLDEEHPEFTGIKYTFKKLLNKYSERIKGLSSNSTRYSYWEIYMSLIRSSLQGQTGKLYDLDLCFQFR